MLHLLLLSLAAAEEAAPYARVSGRVVDASTGGAVADATVLVVEANVELRTGLDGRYGVSLAPGAYTLKFYTDWSKVVSVAVVVADATPRAVDVALPPASRGETVVVVAEADRARDAVLLADRKNAAGVQDALGAESIARGTDKSAAEAVKRVPGVSIVGDRYVYVRGMGERYNTTTLNGEGLPSPEPRRRVVPFNIVPSNLLQSITVVKTPTADLDGDTVGGNVQLVTKDYPERFSVQVGVGGGFNTRATLGPYPSYAGGKTDWLGVDDGTRAAPAEPGPTFEELLELSDAELSGYVSNWRRNWDVTEKVAPPNHSFSLGLGGTSWFGTQKLGYVAALTYDRSWKDIAEQVTYHTRATDPDTGEYVYVPSSVYDQRTAGSTVLWGAVGGLAWRPHANHQLRLRGVYTRRGEDEVRLYEQTNDDGEIFAGTRLRWTEQGMASGVLEGEHVLGPLRLDWAGNLGLATMREPDRREYIYSTANSSIPEGGGEIPLTWFDQSGFRFFNQLRDDEKGGRVDLTVPFRVRHAGDARVKVGGKLRDKYRVFDAEVYSFDVDASLPDEQRTASPDVLFGEDAVDAGVVSVSDTSRPQDSYDGITRIMAGYGLLDLPVLEPLRIVAGVRAEYTWQDFRTGDYEDAETTPDAFVVKQYTDVLPSALATLRLGEATNLRAAYFTSIARPDYFELVPYRFTNYYKNSAQTGNPELDRTRVHSADLRLETFPGPESVLAVTGFYKRLIDPIETVYVSDPEQGQLNLEKPFNIPFGQALGGELEARHHLGFVAPWAEAITYGVNLTAVWSRVSFADADLGEGDVVIELNDLERPLAGQSPYLVNASLGYRSAALGFNSQVQLNVTGPRLITVGANGLPSTVEAAYHSVDLALGQALGEHVTVGVKGTNLTNPLRRYTQEGLDSLTWRTGQTFSASVTGTF